MMQKYLLLDRRVLNPQGMENVQLEVTAPKKDKEHGVLFSESEPWEIRIDNGYPNVIYDKKENIYRCYYTLFIEDKDSEGVSKEERERRDYQPREDRVPALAYAESEDGICWRKPKLHLVDFRGSTENNLIFPYAHGTGVMLDEREVEEEKRYKMVTKIDQPGHAAYMAVSFSKDGVHWKKPIRWKRFNPPADSHNLPFWDEEKKRYCLLSRVWKDGIRITTMSHSYDFLDWSEPIETLRGGGFERQIYAMPAFSYGNLYLGFASVIHEGDRKSSMFDQVDCELTWAVEPEHFDWVVAGQNFIERGEGTYPKGEADCGCIYASPPVPLENGDLLFYYMGGNGKHTNFRESSLMRAFIKKDRFASYQTIKTEEEGILSTCKFKIQGEELEILAEPIKENEKSGLSVMIASNWNKEAFSGFSFEDCVIEEGEEGWKKVSFAQNLSQLSGKDVSIRLRFYNMRVWAIKGAITLTGHRLWEGAGEEEYAIKR